MCFWCTIPLYLPIRMVQTQTMAANKCKGYIKMYKNKITKKNLEMFCHGFRIPSTMRFTNLFCRELSKNVSF